MEETTGVIRMRHVIVASVLALASTSCKTTDSGLASAAQPVAPLVGCAPLTSHSWIRTYTQLRRGGSLQLRVGVMDPSGPPKADVLFLHGFADRLDNHRPLFEALVAKGFRVFSFDFPGHGESCGPASSINAFDFTSLAAEAAYVERTVGTDPTRPLFLVGWSTGGLLAERMMQDGSLGPLSRPVSGMVLLAPGVSVYPLVGDNGSVTPASLTRNPAPPHFGVIQPTSPLKAPLFAAALVANSKKSHLDRHPANLPTLVIAADDVADKYVKTPGLKAWVKGQRQAGARSLLGVQCAGARHELDNEPAPTGPIVRAMAASYLSGLLEEGDSLGSQLAAPCAVF